MLRVHSCIVAYHTYIWFCILCALSDMFCVRCRERYGVVTGGSFGQFFWLTSQWPPASGVMCYFTIFWAVCCQAYLVFMVGGRGRKRGIAPAPLWCMLCVCCVLALLCVCDVMTCTACHCHLCLFALFLPFCY